MKKLLTLFPQAENVHLTKDVGMIPFILHRYFQYDSTLACYQNGEYEYLKSEVKGLKISFIKKVTGNQTIDSILFLILNFRSFTILQLYHFTSFSLIIAIVFKTLTLGKGIVYLKLDAGDNVNELKFEGIRKLIFSFTKGMLDIISAENSKIIFDINESKLFAKPIQLIPNGYYPEFEEVNVDKKENIILTVGRIGSYQKNNELLLEAFNIFCAKFRDWKLIFVGPVTPEFQEHCEEYFAENIHLNGKIVFTGNIQNRKELRDFYLNAKIFALTSRFEGFPLVYLEAMNAGCTIVSTENYAAFDVTGSGKYGKICEFNNSKQFATALVDLAGDDKYLLSNFNAIRGHARTNFYWPTICAKIDQMITNYK